MQLNRLTPSFQWVRDLSPLFGLLSDASPGCLAVTIQVMRIHSMELIPHLALGLSECDAHGRVHISRQLTPD